MDCSFRFWSMKRTDLRHDMDRAEHLVHGSDAGEREWFVKGFFFLQLVGLILAMISIFL